MQVMVQWYVHRIRFVAGFVDGNYTALINLSR